MFTTTAASHDVFEKFDIVCAAGAAEDNFFYGGPTRPAISGALHKSIMREWRILREGLPDSIFVRAYEDHIDLLRAAIVGAAGTPYHDFLFFFDFHFHSRYPTLPPRVHYHSHGLHLNPNLYRNGKVCLSLLNTWPGREQSEHWNPNESTALQVLVSIQALVLNSNPFFNEPGVQIQEYSVTRSQAYNDEVFLLSCQTTTYLLRRPPRCFEQLVDGHFRRRAGAVLRACRAYAEGRVRVGEYDDHNNKNNDTGGDETATAFVGVSELWQLEMADVYRKLVAAFESGGIPVDGAPEALQVETGFCAAACHRCGGCIAFLVLMFVLFPLFFIVRILLSESSQ